MKRCPTCKRTYPDDTLAFCLIDGSVLSAPFDAQGNQPHNARTEPPPTEVFHQSPARSDTVPAPRPQVTIPGYSPAPLPTQAAPSNSSAKWIALGAATLVVLVIAGVGILLAARSLFSGSDLNQNRSELSAAAN